MNRSEKSVIRNSVCTWTPMIRSGNSKCLRLIASFSGGVVSSVMEAVVSVMEVSENRVVARAHDRLVTERMPRLTSV